MKGGACPFCKHPVAGVWEDKPPSSSNGSGFPMPVILSEGPCG